MKFVTLSLIVLSKVFSLVTGENSQEWKSVNIKDNVVDSYLTTNFDGVLKSSPKTYMNNSITSISTYSLPRVLTSHHSKKLHKKLRRHRISSKSRAPNIRMSTKFKTEPKTSKNNATFLFSNLKEINNNVKTNKVELNSTLLTLSSSFNDGNESDAFATTYPSKAVSENRNAEKEFLTAIQIKNPNKKKKMKRNKLNVNNKAVMKIVASNETNSQDIYSDKLQAVKTSNSVGEPRTMSLLVMNALTLPAILLELVTIAAFIFVSPVLGFGVLLMALLGILISGFGFLFFI